MVALLYLNDIPDNNKVNHINKHIKHVIFVLILDSGYETPQFVLGITVRSYATNAFCECLPMGLRQFPSETRGFDAQTTFPICQGQIASIAFFQGFS